MVSPPALRSFSGNRARIPDTAQSGDLAILVNGASATVFGIDNIAPPQGWMLASDLGGSGFRSKVFFRILQAGEAGTEVGPLLAGITQAGGVCLVFRPSRATGYEAVLAGAQATDGNPAAIAMVTTGKPSGTVALVFGRAAVTLGNVELSGTSPSMTRSGLDLTSMEVAFQVFNAVGTQNLVADMGDEGSDNQLHAVLFVPR
jgi:hypothetical protein